MLDNIFTKEFLKKVGFILIKREKSKYSPYLEFGSAKDRTGMTIIYWNTESASCTYFGKKLDTNNFFAIEKDGGTRTVFKGYVYNQEDVKKILSLTW